MLKRKSAARASIWNLREANKKRQKKGKQNPHQENEHWPKAAVLSITASEFPEMETGDTLDLDLDLDPNLREWCEHQDISMGQVVDEDGKEDGNDINSNLSSSEDCGCLDSFKEITEPSELKVFSDRNCRLRGTPQNRVWAAGRRDLSPPCGGSVLISGCVSDAPTISFGTCPLCGGIVLFYHLII
jgi:hypothetical protein